MSEIWARGSPNITRSERPTCFLRRFGLTFQTWQLKELRPKGLIAFYETRAREVILYFRQLKPSQTLTLPLHLVATVPGTYTAPASSAYLYYTDEHKTWVKPIAVTVQP